MALGAASRSAFHRHAANQTTLLKQHLLLCLPFGFWSWRDELRCCPWCRHNVLFLLAVMFLRGRPQAERCGLVYLVSGRNSFRTAPGEAAQVRNWTKPSKRPTCVLFSLRAPLPCHEPGPLCKQLALGPGRFYYGSLVLLFALPSCCAVPVPCATPASNVPWLWHWFCVSLRVSYWPAMELV